MSTITMVTETELRSAVGLGDAERAAIAAVFPMVSDGRASMPPIMRLDVPAHNGEVDVKTAWLPGVDGIAVKVSAGFFDNPARGLPSLGGLMVVLDAETGIPRAALFDNGWLTDLRTALAGAVAADALASEGAHRAGVLGAGAQAHLQVAALARVRTLDHVIVWARRDEQARALAARITDELDVAATTAASPADVAAAVDVLITTTPATAPLVTAAMLHPGLHVTAMGSDAEHKQEVAADAIAQADVVVCDSRAQSARLGELRAAVAAGFDIAAAVELGEVVAGTRPGRTGDHQVTICDLTGTGAQDTAIASLAVARAHDAGLGTTIAT